MTKPQRTSLLPLSERSTAGIALANGLKWLCVAAALAMLLVACTRASAGTIYITEFLSDTGHNEKFEFVEFTNVGSLPVDMTGWSEDDSSATPNKSNHSLSGFGTLAPGESAIFTEANPTAFRNYWGSALPAATKVVGPYTNDNLGTTSDSITLFNATGTLVDRLDYSTTNGGSADGVTRNAPLSALGLNNSSLWVNSSIGDSFGSFSAAQNSALFGNPGHYPVPEPSTLALSFVALLGLAGICIRAVRAVGR